MKFSRAVVVLVLAGVLLPAAAFAHRRASQAERRAVLAAVVRQRELSSAQAACQVVTISTANRNYAETTWPSKLTRSCMRVAANGVIIEHHTARGWQFVTVGSSFQCPIEDVPARVARDFGVCG